MGTDDSATGKRPGWSIGTKLTVATLAVLVAVSSLLYRELTRRERESLILAKETAANMLADLFAESLSAPLDFDDADAVQKELSHLESNPEVQCAAVFAKAGGAPVAKLERGCDAGRAIDIRESFGPSAAGADLRPADVARPVRYDDRVEVARIVKGRGATVGSARIVFSLARENAAFAASRRRILWLTMILALGTAGVLIALSRTQIIRPLRNLGEAARRVGGGDFATRVTVASQDELGELATAFNRMSAEIGEREQRLAAITQHLRDLFEALGQAIVAFDKEGNVRGEVSREAKRVFGATDLEGQSVGALLFGKESTDIDAQAFAEWRGMAFDVALAEWSKLAELAPHELTLSRPGGEPVPLEVSFKPVTKGNSVDRVMMLATDVSEKRRLLKAIDTQQEEHQKRMAAMRRLVAGGAQLFVRFLQTASGRLERAVDEGVAARHFDEVFRSVHTLKGEARAFELFDLEKALHSAEDVLARVRVAGNEKVGDEGVLVGELARARDALDRAREDFIAASPIGAAALEQVTVQRADLSALLIEAKGADGPLAEAARRLAFRPFGEAMSTIAVSAPDWASRDGKKVELVIEGRELRVPPELADVLAGVLTHLVRNAIAHGIESPEERIARGKPATGMIWASASMTDIGLVIVVEDDGRGIDLAAVSARARALGISQDPDVDPIELVFAPGLSTRATSDGLSGRGVGMDAVRVALREVGYLVFVFSEPGAGTKMVIEPA